MRVAILYNDDPALAHGDPKDALAVRGVLEEVDAVAQALGELGHEPVRVRAADNAGALLGAIAAARAQLVFNLCEAIGGDSRLEAAAAWLLEWSGVAYTGAGPVAMTLALDKPVAKAVLASRGLPVAAGCTIELLQGGGIDQPAAMAALKQLKPPLIVKPASEDASHGIGNDSVVDNAADALRQAQRVVERYRQAALVEEFASGRELNIALLGNGDTVKVLSFGEIDYAAFPAGRPPLVTYEAKWVPESVEYQTTPSGAAKPMSSELETRLRRISMAAYRALGLRDYGRVDVRLKGIAAEAASQPVILEVNPNPDISPDAGLARAAYRSGLSYGELIERIVESARTRSEAYGRPGSSARATGG